MLTDMNANTMKQFQVLREQMDENRTDYRKEIGELKVIVEKGASNWNKLLEKVTLLEQTHAIIADKSQELEHRIVSQENTCELLRSELSLCRKICERQDHELREYNLVLKGQRFSDVNLRQEMSSFFEKYFGLVNCVNSARVVYKSVTEFKTLITIDTLDNR